MKLSQSYDCHLGLVETTLWICNTISSYTICLSHSVQLEAEEFPWFDSYVSFRLNFGQLLEELSFVVSVSQLQLKSTSK